MTSQIQTIFFQRLSDLYARMDEAWTTAASHYGFVCRGCPDNCCETKFYHHTHIEKHYLASGMATLAMPTVKTIQKKAKEICEAENQAKLTQSPFRMMCPLNQDGLCLLYRFRPMICRLHGIPHELTRPGASATRQQGCRAGENLFNAVAYHKFDRTPFYTEMAEIEMAYRGETKNQVRIKQTISEMLLSAK